MIATIFGGSLGADIAIFATIIGMFGAILKMLVDQNTLQKSATQSRKEEIKNVLAEVLNGQPNKVSVQQPLRIVSDPQMLTKEEHVQHCSHMERRVLALEGRADRIEQKMETDKEEIIHSGEERAIHIHNRINDIDRKVSALDERTQTTNGSLVILGQKLDRMLERLKA